MHGISTFDKSQHDGIKMDTQYVRLRCVMSVKSVSIRMEAEMLEKLGYVAEYEGRSINSHILVLVRHCILEFEERHGKIEGTIRPDVNVKPSRKS